MKNPIAPKSNSSQEKVSKKFPIFFIVVVVLLLVIGGLGYFFRDNLSKFVKLKGGLSGSTLTQVVSSESPFEDLVGEEDYSNILHLLDYYELDGDWFYADFLGYENNVITVGKGDDLLASYNLSDDFIVICTGDSIVISDNNIDASRYYLNYSELSYDIREKILSTALNISTEKRREILSSYPHGKSLSIGLSYHADSKEVRSLTLFLSDPNVCYE